MKNFAFLLIYMSHTVCCLGQSDWVNYNTENSPLLDNRVSSIALDHHNNLWGAYAGSGGSGNGIVKFDGHSWTHYNTLNSGLPNNDVRDIAIDRQGNLWFACYNAGIVKFDGVSTWTRYHKSNSNIAGNDVVDIEFDSNNNLWVGCYFSGVSKFNGASWTIYTKSNAPFADSNCISDLTIDKANNVWVGMDCQGGMAKFTSSSGIWTSYKTSNSSIPDHTVTSLQADTADIIWASHINVDASSFNGSTWTAYHGSNKLDKFTVDEQGTLWGCGYGLYKFGNGTWAKISIPEAADTTYAFGIAASTTENFWLSTYSGLWYHKVNTPPVFEIAPIIVDEDFESFKVQVTPGPVPESEKEQTVTYTLFNLDDQKITATINAQTGEITLTSVNNAFGTATLKIVANDGQATNNIHEVLVTITINPIEEVVVTINTPPVFEVPAIIVDEDFEVFKVQVSPGPIPESEKDQTVTYTLFNLDDQKVKATINAQTGEITLTSVDNAFGTATLKIVANDGQTTNNIYEILVTVTINQVEEIITGNEVPVSGELNFFPNPASTTLTCSINDLSTSTGVVVMTDCMGHEVMRSVVTAENPQINITDLPAGIYLVKFVGPRFSKWERILKQ